jgi:hypothetical protein
VWAWEDLICDWVDRKPVPPFVQARECENLASMMLINDHLRFVVIYFVINKRDTSVLQSTYYPPPPKANYIRKEGAMSKFIGFVPRQMGSEAAPIALWKHLLSLLHSAQEMADSSRQLGTMPQRWLKLASVAGRRANWPPQHRSLLENCLLA